MRGPNQRVETNRRPAHPTDWGGEPEHALCARPLRSAAVAHPDR